MSLIGTLGSIFIDLRAGAANFESDMGRAARVAAKRAAEMQKDAEKIGKAIGLNLSAFATASNLAVKAAIDRADDLDEMAQKVGASVRSLSRLDFAANLEGVEDFTGVMVKFNRSIREAEEGNNDQARAFKALGVQITDANGKLKSTDVLLIEAAESISQYEDGVAKGAAANALFGKTGAELIPFLNNGAEGLERLAQRADVLGLTIDEKTSKAAGDLNDKIFIMQGAAGGLATRVAAGLLPVMNDLGDEMVDYATDAETAASWTTAVERALKGTIITGITIKAVFEAAGTAIGSVAAAQSRLLEGVDLADKYMPPVFFYKMSKNAGAALEILKQGSSDIVDIANADAERIAAVIRAGTETLDKAMAAAEAAAGNAGATKGQLKFGSAADSAAEQKAIATWTKALQEYNQELQKQEAEYLSVVESMQSAETRAKSAYTRTRQIILDNTQAGTEARSRLILQAEDKLAADLAQIHNEAWEREQEALRNRLETEQRMRVEADRGLRNDPMAAAFGIDSLEDLERAMDPVKAAALGMGEALNSAFSRAADSSAAMLTNILLFGEQGEMSAKRVAQALVQDTVQGLIRVGIQMAVNFAAAKLFGTASTAASVAQAGGLSAAWAPAAISASIATLGGAGAAGMSSYLGSLAAATAASSAAAAAGGAAALGASAMGGGRMNGGPVFKDTLHPLLEAGDPELLRQGGNYYLATGSKGGMVSPAKQVVPVPSAANTGGFVVENYAPGLVFTPKGRVVTVEMLPEVMEMVDQDQAARASTGRGKNIQATSRRLGAQQRVQR